MKEKVTLNMESEILRQARIHKANTRICISNQVNTAMKKYLNLKPNQPEEPLG